MPGNPSDGGGIHRGRTVGGIGSLPERKAQKVQTENPRKERCFRLRYVLHPAMHVPKRGFKERMTGRTGWTGSGSGNGGIDREKIMRIKITGEKSFMDELGAELARDGVRTEAVETSADRAELRLGLFEWAAILAIVVNVAKLIEYLMAIIRRLKEGEKRQLEVKSAAATTVLEIRGGMTAEELARLLAPHQPQQSRQSGQPRQPRAGASAEGAPGNIPADASHDDDKKS